MTEETCWTFWAEIVIVRDEQSKDAKQGDTIFMTEFRLNAFRHNDN